MNLRLWNWERLRASLLAGLAAPVGLSLALMSQGSEPLGQPEKLPAIVGVAAPEKPASPVSLAEYRRLALEKQPALAAYRASVAAAEAKCDALDHMRLAGLLRRDLPTRRKQAEQGVLATQAQLLKAESDTRYAVTRNYLTALYAQEQLKIATAALDKSPDAVSSLYYLKAVLEKPYKGAEEDLRKDVKKWHLDRLDVLIQVTQGRRAEAQQGVFRALAALREAIGLDLDCPLAVDLEAKLPTFDAVPPREQIVALALDRRGEILQSSAGIEVTTLEIDAQKRLHGLRGQTFASGSDLHSEPVPQGFANGDYRPGAITIEMPGQLIGHKSDRIEQVEALQGRAVAVADKTRHLVTLEAEDAYYKWEQAKQQAAAYEEAARNAVAAADEVLKKFNVKDEKSASVNDLIEARVRATQIQVLANEARYHVRAALAALERVTAGGFQPGFDK
jgi:outer membrane protein TolC